MVGSREEAMIQIRMPPQYYGAQDCADMLQELLAPEALVHPYIFDKHPPITSKLHRLVYDQDLRINVVGMDFGGVTVSVHNYVSPGRYATKGMKQALKEELKSMFGKELGMTYDDRFPDQIMLSSSEIMEAIQHSQHPAVKEMYEQRMHEKALAVAAGEKANQGEHSYAAYLWI